MLRKKRLILGAVASVSLGAAVFACGSEEPGNPVSCDGLACSEAGTEASAAPDTSAPDASATDSGLDASVDSAADTATDAAACVLPTRDPDAGPSGTLEWALNFGVTGITNPSSIARDLANGDIVVTGSFWGTTNFGGGVLASQAPSDGSGADLFLVRFDKTGSYKWGAAWGNGSLIGVNAVAVGPAGEMVIAGILRSGTLDLGCGPISAASASNMFVAKLDKAGTCVWSKGFGVAGVSSLAIDGTGSMVLAGGATGNADFGGGALSGQYIARLSAGGAHLWSKAFTGATSYGGPWVSLDRVGDAVFVGNTSAPSIDLGGGGRSSPNGNGGPQTNAAFTAKFASNGNHVWSKRYAYPSTVTGVAATDPCGNILIHGDFGGTVDFGAGTLVATDTTSDYGFIAKLNPQGDGIWNKAIVGKFSPGQGAAFALRGIAGDRYGGGTIVPRLMGDAVGGSSTADFGGGPIRSLGRGSLAIASFGERGLHQWSTGTGAPSTATASFGVASAAAAWESSLAVVGAFNRCTNVCSVAPQGTTLVLAGRTLTATSGQDLFIANFLQ